eukprot:NODE_498_length_1524_cov_2.803268.p1 GENE.NODE_498_length_1524_cov_2.803268~~NODE_498_length_1524_cov_2.803268.p1  ORF type:complete len:436 (+),score=56.79 NODE_498_length_1524_cov_2.803268:192-1310(+)
MVDDMHFWGLRPIRTVVPADHPPNGDVIALPPLKEARKGEATDDEGPEVDLHVWRQDTIAPERPRMASDEVDSELALCQCLMRWDAFAAPDDGMVNAVQHLAALGSQPAHLGMRCLLRQNVVSQLMYEAAHAEQLPDCMKHHAAARYRLRSNRVTVAHHHSERSRRNVVQLQELIPSITSLRERLDTNCCKEGCLRQFAAHPQAVRNWRILWRSLLPSTRREALLCFHAASLADHQRSNRQSAWHVKYSFMGEDVCRDAFLALAGVCVSSLEAARNGALRETKSSLSLKELLMCQRIANTNREPLYLDARQWLEHYAGSHGEQSPMDCLTFLPAGRKQFYYFHYKHDRETQKRNAAGFNTFMEAWRIDVNGW